MSSGASACERLAASREHVRYAMQAAGTHLAQTVGTNHASFLGGLFNTLASSAGTGLVGTVLNDWWHKQPLRLTCLMAVETTNVLLQPVARRHPYALVLGAAAAGGLLVRLRPWRWISLQMLMDEAIKHLPLTLPRAPR